MMNRTVLAAVLLAASIHMSAQSSVSPYSMFGTGAIDTGNHGISAGMAGLGIGLRETNTLNSGNPASLTAIRPKTFILDLAASGSMSGFSGQNRHAYSGTGNIDRVGFGFRIGSFVSTSIGITPFTMTEYRISKSAFIDGKDSRYTTWFEGSGGLHKAYVSFGFNVFRDLSVGITGSIIMGQVTHSEASDYWTAKTKSVSAVTPYLDFGIQYHRSLGRYTSVTAGVTGSYRKDIAMHNTYTLYDNDTTTVSGSVKPTTTMTVPAYAGAGISYTSRTVTAGIDYIFQKWSAASSGSDLIRYKDMHKITLGISYIPNEHDVRRYWKRIKYRFGASVDDSYLTAGGIRGYDWSVTAGMVFPVRNSTSFYWALKFRRSSFPTGNRNTISENCVSLTFGISFGETWFMRKQYE